MMTHHSQQLRAPVSVTLSFEFPTPQCHDGSLRLNPKEGLSGGKVNHRYYANS